MNNSKVCTSLDEALNGTVLAAAITARRRDLSHVVFDSNQGAKKLLDQAKQLPVALVFGTEVSKCQIIVNIPANPAYSSLNLASAVQVMVYELRMALSTTEHSPQSLNTPASFQEIELFYCHLEQAMISCGFLDPKEPKRLMQRIRRLFSRTRLEKEEVNILRGILNSFEKHI